MTEREEQAAAQRRADLFSRCHSNFFGIGHQWNMDTMRCQRCEAPFPYSDGEKGDKK